MSSFGGTVKLTGESEYKKALQDITSNLKVLGSEMKVVTSQYDKNDKSTSNLSQQNEVLNKKIDEQKEKVRILTEALEQSKQETGENSETTKKWQTQLNNAQADLNKMERELKSNNEALSKEEDTLNKTEDELKDYGKATDDAGEKTSRFGDILKANLTSEAIIEGIKAIGHAMADIGKIMIDTGKQALDSYAEYEQLAGGAELMFGNAYNTVAQNAANAYKTVQMSQNEYLTQVNGFATGLKTALGGNEQAAADLANKIIAAEADVVAATGNTRENIENAFNGIMKSNYTMLDNLQLGIKPTKEGFQEVIDKVNEWNAANGKATSYQIDNLADCQAALVDYIEMQGLAGYAAKEAAGTIEGSTAMMRAAWQNLLTGIADDNADFDTLVNNFVESAVNVAGNILPRVATIIDGIMDLALSLSDRLIEHMPEIMDTLNEMLQSLLDGIMEMMPALGETVGNLLANFTEFIFENLPLILDAGIAMILELIQGIADTLPELIPVAVNAVLQLVTTILNNVDLVIETGIQVLEGLITGIVNAIPELLARAPEIIIRLSTKLIELLPEIISAGIRICVAIGTGLIQAIPQLVANIPVLIRNMVSALGQGVSDMWNVGRNLVAGIWEGISGSLSWIKNLISGWVGNVKSFIKRLFGINSPSTVFRDEIGANLALGIGEGFTDTMNEVSETMGDAIPTEFSTSVNAGLVPSIYSGYNNATQIDYLGLMDKLSSNIANSVITALSGVVIENNVNLDGRKVTQMLTPMLDKELGRIKNLSVRGV